MNVHSIVLAALSAAIVRSAIAHGAPDPLPQQTDWPATGGSQENRQYSALDQINASNVGQLGLLWVAELGVGEGLVGNPLVKDGVIYQSAPRGRAIATDARTGKTVWLFDPGIVSTNDKALWSVNFTRGLALDDGSVYVAAGCELYAVDRKTGTQRWHSRACDPTQIGGIIGPPVVGGGKVFIGTLGSGRSFAAALDAATGTELWRFYTVPGDPKKPQDSEFYTAALKTWGDRFGVVTQGGAGVWGGMVFDNKTNLFIFGSGNPMVDGFEAEFVDKEMLYSNSLIAVDATTGKYVWHLQQTTGDVFHPGDATAHMMLVDMPVSGATRRVLLQAAKNGYFYVVDANTGEFLSGKNYVPTSNYNAIDPKSGTLSFRKELRFWEKGNENAVMQPGGWGAHGWELSSFSPQTGLVYIPAFVFPYGFLTEAGGFERHGEYGFSPGAKYKTHGLLIAWDPVKQVERWSATNPVTISGGVLSTGGGVVFQGTAGAFNAYDASSGKKLWSHRTESNILGGASTAMVDGKQVIFVPSGDGNSSAVGKYSHLMSTPDTYAAPSRLLAFSLGGTATLSPYTKEILEPARPRQPEELAAVGGQLFRSLGCGGCHGDQAVLAGNGRVPDLRNIREPKLQTMPRVLRDGLLIPFGMPAFPEITDDDIRALQAYIVNRGWDSFEQQKN